MATNIRHLLVWRPEQDSNLRPSASGGKPEPGQTTPTTALPALTWHDNGPTPPDDARLLLTLAPSLALTRLVSVRASSHLPLPESPVF